MSISYLGQTTFAVRNDNTSPSRTTPTHVADDIALLTVQEANQDPSFIQQMGFVEVTGSPQGVGTAGAAGATELRNYWKRFSDSAEETVQMNQNGGDHIAYVMHLYRGVKKTGDPWNARSQGVVDPASAAVNIPHPTTTVDDCLHVLTTVNAIDSAVAPQWGSFTNGDLTDLTERFNDNHASGVGGGVAIVTGRKVAAGACGNTTSTLLSSSRQAYQVIALEPHVEEETFPPTSLPSTGLDVPRDPAYIRRVIGEARTLTDLTKVLARELSKLVQSVRYYERIAVLPFGATVRPSGRLSRVLLIQANAVTDVLIENPSTPREGAEIILDIQNSTGAAMGNISWGSEYLLTGAFVKPANGKHRLISFYRSADGKWRELYRSNSDLS